MSPSSLISSRQNVRLHTDASDGGIFQDHGNLFLTSSFSFTQDAENMLRCCVTSHWHHRNDDAGDAAILTKDLLQQVMTA